jgi:hypothetical protein
VFTIPTESHRESCQCWPPVKSNEWVLDHEDRNRRCRKGRLGMCARGRGPGECPAHRRRGPAPQTRQTPASASASLKTGWKRRSGAIWRGPGTGTASVGSGGVRNGCTNLCGCTTATRFDGACRSRPSTIGPITLEVKQTGERSAGNPHAAFDVAGAGNAARSRYCDTRRRKGETRRASPRPYL